MTLLCVLVYLTGTYPLWCAWRANQRTSLAHAVIWTAVAWMSWGTLLLAALCWPADDLQSLRYLALCLVGAASVAVLGARRPGVDAWNFVVLGLLAVFLLSWAEGFLTGGSLQMGVVRMMFLTGTLGIGILNYLPTRLAPAALLLAAGCVLAMMDLQFPAGSGSAGSLLPVGWLLGLVPWAAWFAMRWRSKTSSVADRQWRHFRDRYGLVWGQRFREQFNASAAHAGLAVELRWRGLQSRDAGTPLDAAVQSASLVTLQALMKRFGEKETQARPPAPTLPGG